MPLSEDQLRTAARPKAGQAFLWDDLVSGFGVRLSPGTVAFVVQWRDSSGAKRRKTLKRWPACSVKAARDLARVHLCKSVAARETGGDQPMRLALRSWCERKAIVSKWRPRYREKVFNTVATYVELVDNPRVKLTPGAVRAIDLLGRTPVAAVTRSQVIAVADAIAPGTAEQFMAILSSAFNDWYEREWCSGNPARNRLRVTGGRPVRHRRLTEAEFLELWHAFKVQPDPIPTAFAVLAFTGVRRREATLMAHKELDLDAGKWVLQPERRKTGRKDPEPFQIHLHPKLVALLQAQPILEGSPFVFWGRRDRCAFDFQKLCMDRVRKRVSVRDWRLHDIRRFVRSGMGQLGISQAVAEMCLGHRAKAGLVAVYDQHSYRDEKAEAWQRWGDYLVKLLGI